MPSSFIRGQGRSIRPCPRARSAPTTRPCFPPVRGRSPCVAFAHVRDQNFYFQQFAPIKTLFDLIPAGSSFLTLAKSHPIFSQYCANNYSVIRKFATNSSCPRVFLCLRCCLLRDNLTNGDVPFLSYSGIGLLKRRHVG